MTDFKRHNTTKKKTHTPNKGFAIARVPCFADTFCARWNFSFPNEV